MLPAHGSKKGGDTMKECRRCTGGAVAHPALLGRNEKFCLDGNLMTENLRAVHQKVSLLSTVP